MLIDNLNLKWSEGKEVNTRRGARILKTAEPTPLFWSAWRSDKEQLQDQGISCRKTSGGDWEACLWTVTGNPAEVAATPLKSHAQPSQSSPEVFPLIANQDAAKVAWSDEQTAIFQWFATGTGSLVVQARAGTGKTTTIKEAFTHAPESRMLYAVFNKKNQVEAQEKISDARVEVKTLHSVGFSYICNVWPNSKPDNSVELDRIVACNPELAEKEEIAGLVERLVGFAKNTLLAPTQAALETLADERGIFSPDEDQPNGWTVKHIAASALCALEAAKTRDSQGRISFNDMVWLPVVQNWVTPRFDLVVVDESQDMNVPQLEMAIKACAKGGRICIVGDDRQAIYGFRGAAQDGMNAMKTRLNAATLGLTTTYRCPKKVVEIAAAIVPDYKAAPSAPEGEVTEVCHEKLLSDARIGDAILSRLNAPLMSACLNLIRRGTSARIEGRDIGAQLVGMVRKLRAKSVPDFFRKLESWGDKQRARLGHGKNAAAKITQIDDQVATLSAVAEGATSVSDIESKLYSLFQDSDSKNAKPAVVLSSVHKAKGLEWNRVFILNATFKKSTEGEEANIRYVAITRAKKHLTFVE